MPVVLPVLPGQPHLTSVKRYVNFYVIFWIRNHFELSIISWMASGPLRTEPASSHSNEDDHDRRDEQSHRASLCRHS